MLRLRTFGGLSATSDAGPLSGAAVQRRRLALLALLAASGDRGVSRDRLVALLWPESDEERARKVLAQALYMLRRDLHADALFLGTTEVRLNPDVITSDIAEFEDALERGEAERAVAVYGGAFLDGVYVADAPQFERWVEEERALLARRYATALERLATTAATRGDRQGAAAWWRQLAAADPLNSRVATQLMAALAAAGDCAGALQHARVHTLLVQEELQAPPDPAVTSLAERLRAQADAPQGPPTHHVVASVAQTPVRQNPAQTVARHSGPWRLLTSGELRARPVRVRRVLLRELAQRLRGWRRLAAALVVATIGIAAFAAAHRPRGAPPIVAVGFVRDYTGGDTTGVGRPLPDMLATNLARVPGLQVVSNARMYELLGQFGSTSPSATMLTRAARTAGATVLVEGALYRTPASGLRLDLRLVDLATGAVQGAYEVEGADAFGLVDQATAELAAGFDHRADVLHVADVTTKSLLAYQLYERGLRSTWKDTRVAHEYFLAAIREDSTFAMAAYYAWRMELALGMETMSRLEQAVRAADHATDRERLLLRATLANAAELPARVAIAETLAVRYPWEPDGHLLLGTYLMWGGNFRGALPHLRHVIEMDSLSQRGGAVRCRACDAFDNLVTAHILMDSLAAAERVAREWAARQPGARYRVAELLELQGRVPAARATLDTLRQMYGAAASWRPAFELAVRAGEFSEADSIVQDSLRRGSVAARGAALWLATISLRNQGRFREALAAGRLMREFSPPAQAPTFDAIGEAEAMFDLGHYRASAAIFDSIANAPFLAEWERHTWGRSKIARHRTWNLTLKATALAAARDTARVKALADTIQLLGQLSAYGRDGLLHHHLRGLLLAARGRLDDAAREYRLAIFSPTSGYTRTNLELGRTLIALGRPREAVAILRPALHGPLEASNYYVTHAELHEQLASAFAAAGERDSAGVHARYVVRAWRNCDPELRPRYQRMRQLVMSEGRAELHARE